MIMYLDPPSASENGYSRTCFIRVMACPIFIQLRIQLRFKRVGPERRGKAAQLGFVLFPHAVGDLRLPETGGSECVLKVWTLRLCLF